MPNEPKADWEKEARELLHRELMVVCVPGRDAYNVEKLTAALRSHAAGAREAEEKRHPVVRAKEVAAMTDSTLDVRIRSLLDIRGKMLDEVEVVEALINRLEKEEHIASRVGGKETK